MATSTECPRGISGSTHDSPLVSGPLGQLSQRKEQNPVCSWVLQEVTHLQRQNTISRLLWSTASVRPCSKPKQVSDGHVLSPVLLCVHSLSRREGRQRKVSHMVPHLPHPQTPPGDQEKNHTEDFERRNCKPRPSLQSIEKEHQTWTLCFLMPGTLRWNGCVKLIPTSSSSLWSMRGGQRAPGLILRL